MRITVIASLEGKIVSKYCNISKSLGGSIHRPLYHGGGMNLHVRPRVNNKNGTIRKQKKIASNKKTGQLCTALYRELWPLLFPDISLTYTLFIRKNVNPGKRVALLAEYFLSLSLFVFLSKEKVDTFTQANIVRSRSD